jgi:RNA polymerase sigma-70 factor (ECF subfamily)
LKKESLSALPDHWHPSVPSINIDNIGIKDGLKLLETKHRQLIDLLYFGGYSQAEAAKMLGIPLGTVKTRTRSAIRHLRQALNTPADER